MSLSVCNGGEDRASAGHTNHGLIETVNQAQWGDCSSAEDDLFSEDDVADISDMNQERAMVMVNSVNSLEALAADHSFSDCSEGKDINLKLAEKLSDIASILGISMEGRLDELQSFIFYMLEEEKVVLRLLSEVRRNLELKEN
ncbi:hypothetical protein AAC387_Pa02g1472 [Persea americana]